MNSDILNKAKVEANSRFNHQVKEILVSSTITCQRSLETVIPQGSFQVAVDEFIQVIQNQCLIQWL